MSRLPSKSALAEWIADNPGMTSKRDIAKAFGIKGNDRIELKRLLKELEVDGLRGRRATLYRDPNDLPPVSVLVVAAPDASGDLFARLPDAEGDLAGLSIHVMAKAGDPALGAGDRILARLAKSSTEGVDYDARLIRRIGSGPARIVGLYRKGSEGGRIVPIDKKTDREWRVADADAHGAKDGDLVEAEQTGPKTRIGLPKAKVLEVLGDPMAPRSVSLFAIHQHGIPDAFDDDVLLEAEQAEAAGLGDREDLRHLPLVTIDPADARDHDDAVFAHADDDPGNPEGHVVWVAIADVAHYVTPGSRLDREARVRGNSTYFPDRVVPMLPDRLSGDLCSLHDGVDRACIAVRMVLNSSGDKIGHRFVRGLMRSDATLNYRQVQAAQDGAPDGDCAPLMDGVIAPLFAAYAAASARDRRQPLHLDLPERKIVLSDDGHVTSVAFAERFDAHRLIEEFMILANVAAAETLEAKRRPFLYRVHEEPSPDKLDGLRETATAAGLTLAKGQVLRTSHLNTLLDAAAGGENAEIINMSVLRSMTQAYYAPVNFGHFGLNLKRYAHFTSPIRRYSDLIVHRALISAHGWGEDGLSDEDIETLARTGELISQAERRSMAAERDTNDRYLASFLSERVGNEFEGKISGIARFGLFVRLEETGADGLIPISSLGREYWRHDERRQALVGDESGFVLKLGAPATVRLAEAVPVTGGLLFELLAVDGKALPRSGGRGGKSGARKLAASKRRRTASRKVEQRKRGRQA
jgi:ribonuclease R